MASDWSLPSPLSTLSPSPLNPSKAQWRPATGTGNSGVSTKHFPCDAEFSALLSSFSSSAESSGNNSLLQHPLYHSLSSSFFISVGGISVTSKSLFLLFLVLLCYCQIIAWRLGSNVTDRETPVADFLRFTFLPQRLPNPPNRPSTRVLRYKSN